MGLFQFNYNKPGPGVDPNEPRKKGIKRFFEVLGRDFGDFIKLNLFYSIFFIFPMALFVLALLGILPAYTFIISIIVAFPMGGVYSTMAYCIIKMLRDDPEYVWYDIKRKFVEFLKQGIIPGILYTTFMFGQILFLRRLLIGTEEVGTAIIALELLSLIIISMVFPYVFIQIAYLDLSIVQIFKNSLILAIANLPRSFMGALMGNFIWLLFLILAPASLLAFPIMLLIAFSISWLGCFMWVWPPVDKQFNIESTLRERYEKKQKEKNNENL